MSEYKIGETYQSGPGGLRDAVHAAIILVSSEETVYPGDSLVFVEGTNFSKVNPIRHPGPQEDDDGEVIEPTLERQAVADPFISSGAIEEGTYFHAFLIPGSTEGLRHVFEIKNVKEKFMDVFEDRANAQDSCRGCF